MKQQLTMRQTYYDPAHDGYVAKLKQDVLAYVELEGQHHGTQNKPVTESELKILCLNYIQAIIQTGIEKNQERFLPISGILTARKIQEDAQKKVESFCAIKRDKEHFLVMLIREQDALKETLLVNRWWWLPYSFIVGLSFIEGGLSFPAFRSWNFPTIPAVAASSGLAIGVGLGAHYLGGYIKNATNKLQGYKRYAVSLIPFAIVFYKLGLARATAYSHVADYSPGHAVGIVHTTSGNAIALVSFLLYWLALYLSIRFYKNWQEHKHEQRYKDKSRQVAAVKTEIQSIEKQIGETQANAAVQSSLALEIYEYALSIESGLKSFAVEAAEAYKSKNLRFRTDGTIPEVFCVIPAFTFKTFFQNVKNNTNEND